MKALIDPQASVSYISSWTGHGTQKDPFIPVISQYQNSARVAEVAATEFEVAPPFFWVDCADNVAQDQFWYNTETTEIQPIVNAPRPAPQEPAQPATSGTAAA